ncbi:retrovirus-related pol polyprotein from transposon TNT 1-94 [Tanacetum coccineum]
MIIKKDSEIVKAKVERKYIALKAKKESSDEECSTSEPKNVKEALGDESWIVAMQEELNQFVANDVWELVPQPRNMTITGTKWVFRNKLDENDVVSRNKASQYRLSYSDEGKMFVKFVIKNQYFSPSLEDFAQILRIPCEGACVFSDKWSLDELVYGAPSEGPYQTTPTSLLDDIIRYFERIEMVLSLS